MLRFKSRAADPESFEGAVAGSLDRLFATALRLTRSEADAEDLVQEALVRVLEARNRLRPAASVAGYLHRTLVNLYINHFRHRRVARHVGELASLGLLDGSLYSSEGQFRWSDPHACFENSHFSDAVEAALSALPERFRVVLILSDLSEYTYAEIADELRIPVGTVMSRLFRARRMMRARLAPAASGAVPAVPGTAAATALSTPRGRAA
jgi:RNA polymerase sigma-70 factor (ECF subfamily)